MNAAAPARRSLLGIFDRVVQAGVEQVIADVPPALEECEVCRETDCTQERWLSCPRRLAAEDERKAMENAHL